jgi:uncharacterized membrane protein YfcA
VVDDAAVHDATLAEIGALALVALLAGTVDAMAGGGGLLTVPALLAVGLPPHLALGTNKGQSVFGSLSALMGFWRAGTLDTRRVRPSFIGGLFGSLGGAALVLLVSPTTLKPLVLALLVGASLLVALRPPPPPYEPAQRPPPTGGKMRAYVWAIALAIGMYDGFFGPGTGTLVILAYAYLLREPMTRASANAKVVNFASNLAAVALFAGRGNVVWSIALPMGAAQLAGGVLGARLAIGGGDRVVRLAVVSVVLALCAKVAWDLWGTWR